MAYNYVELGSLITPSKTVRCGDGDYPVLSMTMHNGLVFQDEKFKKVIASKDTSDYKVVYRNQLVISFPIDEGVLAAQRITDAGIVSPAYGIWDIDQSKILPEFLEYALRCDRAIQYYKAKLRGSTARRRTLPTPTLLAFKVPLPCLEEQEKVIDRIHRAQSVKEKRNEQINKLDDLIKARFVEMFGDPVKHLDEGNTVPLATIADRITVGFVGEASSDYTDEGVPYLRTQNVRVNHIDLTGLIYVNEAFHQKNQKSIIHPGDVVISRVGVNRGMAAVIPDSLSEANIANCLIVGGLERIEPYYLAFYMNMSYGKRPQFGASVGSAQGVVNTAILKKWEVYLPDRELQNEFCMFAQQVDKSKAVIQKSLDETQLLFDSLMQKYFG